MAKVRQFRQDRTWVPLLGALSYVIQHAMQCQLFHPVCEFNVNCILARSRYVSRI